jgi:hypothetical protein
VSTFLQLCTRTSQECGIAGSGPSAVTAQTGINAKIVNWVLTAHEEIQLKHPRWRFDWAQATKVLAAQESYNPTSDWSLSARTWDWDGAYVYVTASGATARQPLSYEPWHCYRELNLQGSSGQPQWITEAPDKTIRLYPIPNTTYTVALDYYRKPEVLAANSDTPRMPSQYHMAIVWRAVMLYCGHDENTPLYQQAKINFDHLMSRMEDTELDPLETAEPLA